MDELTRLAHAARVGERDALHAFIDASYAEVWRLCAALVDEQAADDLAQETFVRAMRALRRFRGDSSARVWTLAIARRTCMDELRSRDRRRRRQRRLADQTVLDGAFVPDPAGDVATYELLAMVEPERRAAFVLTQLFRLSYQDAAEVCGCPSGTIRSRVARARDELIKLLDETSGTARGNHAL
jgi:RNA polymerase sigma-70 factor (ECF subfamily)